MRKLNLVMYFVLVLLFLPTFVESKNYICSVYFTGIGCPHCAKTDPVVLGELPQEYPNLIIIEYEIYQQPENAPLLYSYSSRYDTGMGVPLIIFNEEKHIIGDMPILRNVRNTLNEMDSNECPLLDGLIDFNELDLTSLPGKPKIWAKDRILISSGGGGRNEILKELLTTSDIPAALEKVNYTIIEPEPAPLSGSYINFDNAVELDGWIFEWNGKGVEGKVIKNRTEEKIPTGEVVLPKELTLPKIVSLAAVDSINPCALAVLTLMLIAIITYNPKKRHNVLLAGFAFTLAVFVGYLIYGLVIVKFFQLIQTLTSIRLLLYKILGVAAIILGLLNIKDFIKYKPGGFLTEMPLSLRPKVKKIISGITSPKGAFTVGIFITIFLLPCTIGPYVIAGGILSALELVKTIPWLILYNIIFVSPMIAITLLVYGGFTRVENVSGWKDKNIRKLHLTAGSILTLLGVAMILGLV